MKTTTVEAKAEVVRRMKMIAIEANRLSYVILAFVDDEEEVERPATTRSGRALTRRSEIDFSLFIFKRIQSKLTFLLTL